MRLFRRARLHELVPDFIDIADARLPQQLEKSIGRALDGVWERSANVSGEPVREYYLRWFDLQARYPLALLPIGQKRWAKWLLNQGRARHHFSDEQIIAHLRESAADINRGIGETYLVTPEWQERFPDIWSAGEQQRLIAWLCEKYPAWRELRKCKALPSLARFTPHANRAAGANLLAHFCYPSGLQRGALATRASLAAAGEELSCRDVPVGVATEVSSRLPWLGLEVYPVSFIIMSPVPYSEDCYARAGLHRREGVYRIAYWSWELDMIPAEWPSFDGMFDEIWTPSTFVADAMRTRFSLPVLAMSHALLPAAPEVVTRSQLGIAQDDFVFLFMFDFCSELDRKNPDGLIRAFRRAFGPEEPVTLLLKTVRGDFNPSGSAELQKLAGDSNVRIVDELASHERALGLIQMCDCYVSLHRSEGFGLTLAEAMLLRKPVIATAYSGNRDFMNEGNSWLVDFELVPVAAGGAIYNSGRWAEPSVEHAAALMREVFENRAAARSRAESAARELAEKLSPATVGARMKARLDEIRDRATCSRV